MYETLRHFADSWGLAVLVILFLTFIGWTFRRGAAQHHERARTIIFREDDHG